MLTLSFIHSLKFATYILIFIEIHTAIIVADELLHQMKRNTSKKMSTEKRTEKKTEQNEERKTTTAAKEEEKIRSTKRRIVQHKPIKTKWNGSTLMYRALHVLSRER